MNALRQLIEKLNRGETLAGDDIIALMLVVTMLLSLVHLMTMLVTRWGDRNTAMKSLMASILIHGVCILGLEVFDPFPRLPAEQVKPVLPEPEVTTEVLVESDMDIPLPESGNVPIADRPNAPMIELERFELATPEVTPTETPDRQPNELEALSTDARDVTQFEPSEMPELAMPSDTGQEGRRQPGAEDPAADLNTVYESNTADVFAPEMARSKPQPSQKTNTTTADPTAPMTAQDLKFEVTPKDLSIAAATTPGETAIPLPPDAETSDRMEHRAAPIVSPEMLEGTPANSKNRNTESTSGTTFQSRLPRPARNAADATPAERESRPIPDMARTPTPLSNAYDDVRIGDMAPSFSEAVISAATNVENELPTIRRRENPPAAYQLRNLNARRDAAARFGGTRESETAVERSLRWLASVQAADGHWDASDYGSGQVTIDENNVDRQNAGREADTGVTALAILCFLGAGYTHENGRYAIQLDQALDWLIQQQEEDGRLCGNAEYFARMYCHAMATYALAEAYGMQKETVLGPIADPELLKAPGTAQEFVSRWMTASHLGQPLMLFTLPDQTLQDTMVTQFVYGLRQVDDLRLRAALAKAVSFTVSQQNPRTGGWRYRFLQEKDGLQEGDVSMFGWQMMSLKSAEIAGVRIPDRVKTRMNDFLNSAKQGNAGGLYGYRARTGGADEPITPTMTAEALFCQQMMGAPADSPASREAVNYLMRNQPRMSDTNYYYWYYGTLAMYQHGGRAWQDWNSIVRDVLISEQVRTGEFAGSWAPNDPWGRYGGRLYSTTLATLTLEVYYRFLPLYRMNDQASEPK